MASPRFYDKAGNLLPEDAPGERIAQVVHDIRIRRGIRYARTRPSPRDRTGDTSTMT